MSSLLSVRRSKKTAPVKEVAAAERFRWGLGGGGGVLVRCSEPSFLTAKAQNSSTP